MSPKSGELNSCPQVKQEQRQCITEMASHGIIKLFVTVNQNRKKQKNPKTNKQTRQSHMLPCAAHRKESYCNTAQRPHSPGNGCAEREPLQSSRTEARHSLDRLEPLWAPPSHTCAEMCELGAAALLGRMLVPASFNQLR